MDRKETDEEARETKQTGNVLYWILGVGALLMLLAIGYALTRHDGDATPKSDYTPGQVQSDTVAGDGIQNPSTDTLATDMQR